MKLRKTADFRLDIFYKNFFQVKFYHRQFFSMGIFSAYAFTRNGIFSPNRFSTRFFFRWNFILEDLFWLLFSSSGIGCICILVRFQSSRNISVLFLAEFIRYDFFSREIFPFSKFPCRTFSRWKSCCVIFSNCILFQVAFPVLIIFFHVFK